MAGVTATEISNTGVVTWLRGQVDLSPYIGQKIRVRFIVNVPNNTTQADGVYIDDIAFTFGPSQIPLNFVDTAQSTGNWISEGTWGLGLDNFYGTGASSADLGPTAWSGTYFDCEQLKTAAESCDNAGTYSRILQDNANYPPGPLVTATGPIIGPETITDVLFDWASTNRPLNNGAPVDYADTFAGRWIRSVTLSPGTYTFRTISDDGVRLIIDDVAGTDLAANAGGNSGYIINNWGMHSPTLDSGTFTVSSTISRTLTLAYFENGGGAVIELYATSDSYSFTDSPNTPDGGGGFTQVDSLFPGNSSLMLNGFFDLSAATNPTLNYRRTYDLDPNNTFRVEYSTNGGFIWTIVPSETQTDGLCMPTIGTPPCDWQARTVALPTQPNVMIRFRLDTRSATDTDDGVYIAEVEVTG
jgi:hypothetical protein